MPAALISSGVSVLTVPWLPTGSSTGVGTTPWGVTSSPARGPAGAGSVSNRNVAALPDIFSELDPMM